MAQKALPIQGNWLNHAVDKALSLAANARRSRLLTSSIRRQVTSETSLSAYRKGRTLSRDRHIRGLG